MKKSRKKFTKEFKISILRELENGKTSAQLCRENDETFNLRIYRLEK